MPFFETQHIVSLAKIDVAFSRTISLASAERSIGTMPPHCKQFIVGILFRHMNCK